MKSAKELLLELVRHYDVMAGPRAHRIGCRCGSSNDDIRSCVTLDETFREAKELLAIEDLSP